MTFISQINSEQEFWLSYLWVGSLLFAGLIVSLVLIGLGIVVRRRVKESQIIKKIYEQERSNGKEKH